MTFPLTGVVYILNLNILSLFSNEVSMIQEVSMIRVMIVEEEKVIREGLKILLESESDIKVVGSVSNSDAAISKIEEFQPNILLISRTLSESHGFDVIQVIRQKYSQIKIIIFCNQVNASDFVEYLELGVKGCLLKNVSVGQIKEVIRYINKGYTHIENNVFKTVLPELSDAMSALKVADPELKTSLESPESEVIHDDKFQSDPLDYTQNYNSENGITKSYIPILADVAVEPSLPFVTSEKTNKKSLWKRVISSWALVGLGLSAITIGLISYRGGSEIVITDAVVKGKIVSIDSPVKGKLQKIIDLKGKNIEANQNLAFIEPLEDSNTTQINSQLEKDISLKKEQLDHAKRNLYSFEENLKKLPKQSEIFIKVPQATEATKISINNSREIANLEQQIVNQKVTINLLEKEVSNLQDKLTNAKINSVSNQITPIKAPISGVVQNINYTEGDLIPLGQEIATLIDCQNLWLEALVDSKLAAKINLHKDVSVQLKDSQTLISGKINLIETSKDHHETANYKPIVLTSTVPIDNNQKESLSRVIINVDFPSSELMQQDYCNVGSIATVSIN